MILLRKATEADMPLVLAWRNNPLIYMGFYTQSRDHRTIPWIEHWTWWHNRNEDWRMYIIELMDGDLLRPIGVINIGQMDSFSPDIGYYIGEIDLWKRGYGREALSMVCDKLALWGYRTCHLTILMDNKASIKMAENCGFKYVCPSREGEGRWEKSL